MFSLSNTHTHTLTHTHTHTHSLTHTHSHTLVHMLIHKSKQSHTLFLPSHSPTVSSTCTYHHCLLHSHSQTHTFIISFSFSQLTKPQLTYTERKGCKSACGGCTTETPKWVCWRWRQKVSVCAGVHEWISAAHTYTHMSVSVREKKERVCHISFGTFG